MTDLSFNVVVLDATLQLQQQDGTTAAHAPQTFVTARFAGEEAAARCGPVTAGTSGTYTYNYACQFSRPGADELLASIVNQELVVAVCDSSTQRPLCQGTLDLAVLGLGASSLTETIQLQPCGSSGADGLQVQEGASATVALQVQQLRPAEDAAAGNEPAASAAMQWVPASLVPEEQHEFCNVLELAVEQTGRLPPKLQAAADATGGKLACSLALFIEGEAGPLPLGTLPAGAVQGQQVARSRPVRVPLAAAAARRLLHTIQDGGAVHVEVGRHLQPGAELFHDPAFGAYHGHGKLLLSELLVPGSTAAEAEVAVSAAFDAALHAGLVAKSVLPPAAAPSAPKSKPIEDAPPPAADGAPCCTWTDAGTRFKLRIRLWRPIVPPWRPPVAPDVSLRDLIPPRVLDPPMPAPTALEGFQQQMKQVVAALAKDYQEVAAQVSGAGKGAEAPASLQKQLVFQLNHSGKYLQLRDSLKAAVLELVRQQLRRPRDAPAAGGSQAQQLHHQLFASLVDETSRVLQSVKGPAMAQAAAASPVTPSQEGATGKAVARAKELADEAELSGQVTRAQVLLQQRIVDAQGAEVAQAWHDYAALCLRAGQQGRAEEALRQAISHNEEHAASLAALAALALHGGLYTDAAQLVVAEVVGSALKDLFPDSPVAWALLLLIYRAAGKKEEAQSCAQEVGRLAQVAGVWGQSPLQQNPHLQAALLLLDLHLPDEALLALDLCPSLPDSAKLLEPDVLLARARASALLGDPQAALDSANQASRACDPSDTRPAILLGKLHMQAGDHEAAAKAYLQVYSRQPAACPLELYLQLGRCYLAQGQPQYARNVYLQATAARPCASTWLGLAAALGQLGEAREAALALTEASMLDPRNPLVWAHLALAAVEAGRLAEGEQAAVHAFKEGLEDAAIMLQLAAACLERGHAPLAQQVLARALSLRDAIQVRCLLGKALVEQGQQEVARQHYVAALGLVSSPEEHSEVQHALDALQAFG